MEAVEIIRLTMPEFAAVADVTVAAFVEISRPMVSKKQFGKLYEQALACVVAHQMSLSGFGESAEALNGQYGSLAERMSLASVSEGETSVSFTTSGQSLLQKDAWFSLTPYGIQFLQLRRMCIVPIHCAGEEVFYGGA